MNKKLTIQDYQKIAKSRGGKCLSESYTNNKTKLKWQCAEGHVWEATGGSVRIVGTWCPGCIIENKRNSARKKF